MSLRETFNDIKEGKHVKEGMYTDILRVPHMTLTYFIVKVIKNTKLTPNDVTFFSFLMMIAVAGLYANGSYAFGIMAAIFYYISFVLDTVDGCLAREKGIASPLGGWYDKIADRIANPLLFLGITIGVYTFNPSVNVWVWAFLAYAALEFSVIVQYNFRRMFPFGMDEVKKERKKRGWLKEFMLNDFFLMHSIVLFTLFGAIEYYFVFFTFYGWVFNIAMVTVMTYKAKKHIKNEKKSISTAT
jgi:phosphatidylglycerophosphate synthase